MFSEINGPRFVKSPNKIHLPRVFVGEFDVECNLLDFLFQKINNYNLSLSSGSCGDNWLKYKLKNNLTEVSIISRVNVFD